MHIQLNVISISSMRMSQLHNGRKVMFLNEGTTGMMLSKKLGLDNGSGLLFLVNGEPRSLDYMLQDGDRVAFLPVIAGG